MKTMPLAMAMCLAAAVSGPQALGRPGDGAPPDTTRAAPAADNAPAPAGDIYLTFRDYMLRDRFSAPGQNYVSMSIDLAAPHWYAPPTRFDAVITGAGTAGMLGMFIGAVGNTLGWFDEDTSWIVTGSLAAMGAIYGGTTYQEQPRLRYQFGAHTSE